tara:strand:- start:758 stop:976 length:219 start_codon:yes stop_codon:yes gene_type:complete
MNLFFLNLGIFLFSTLITPAYAYLDPGSGSIILQAILGFIAATVATMSFYWNKVKLFLRKFFKKENKDKNSE